MIQTMSLSTMKHISAQKSQPSENLWDEEKGALERGQIRNEGCSKRKIDFVPQMFLDLRFFFLQINCCVAAIKDNFIF